MYLEPPKKGVMLKWVSVLGCVQTKFTCSENTQYGLNVEGISYIETEKSCPPKRATTFINPKYPTQHLRMTSEGTRMPIQK